MNKDVSCLIENENSAPKRRKKKYDLALIGNDNQEIQEAIRLKAYEIYSKRNGSAGSELEDWLIAKTIVLSQAHLKQNNSL